MRDYRAPASVAAVALIGLGALIARRKPMPVGNASVPLPAKPVALGRYLGLWYEIGRYENGFERGLDGVTAEYRARPDGLIQVVNIGRRGGPAGAAKLAEGRAKVVDGSGGARLKVAFFGPFYADYWVLDHADDYAWSIVGEPSGRYLWLLCREQRPAEDLRAALKQRAADLGYDTRLIRPTAQ
jgi:apolipoprotein D and lipocalin family protein